MSEYVPANHPALIPREPKLLSMDQIKATIFAWVHRLGIADWAIDVKFARGYELGDSYADVAWTLSKRRATIRILNPQDRPPDSDHMDMEQTILHELLHIVFAAWHDWSDDRAGGMTVVEERVLAEQPIDRLAWALVYGDRVNKEMKSCTSTTT